MSASVMKIGALCEQIRGVTYSKDESSRVPKDGYVPILRANNITEQGLCFDDLVYVPKSRVAARQYVRENDVVVAASSGSIEVVGKAARAVGSFNGGFGAFCKVLRPNEKVHPAYFSHYFKTTEYRRRVSSLAEGANINNLRNEHIDEIEIKVPTLEEQRRIAAILDKADALRAKRREAIGKLDQLLQSGFIEMFGDPVTNPKGWPDEIILGDVADIVSGITKGRRATGKVRSVPYLAVANVQDRHLKLGVIKTIEATESEIKKYRLVANDLLLTEGGDPDKLGRGALWDASIIDCIHQNHVFRVRITSDAVNPVFLNWLVGSMRGKKYFLRSAKQTTGIASINMSQLKKFPLLVPPAEMQKKFAQLVSRIEVDRQRLIEASMSTERLFHSLQQMGFTGRI